MITAKDLAVSIGHMPLFKNVSLRLGQGEIKGLVAPNGYGKTTLMRLLSGILEHPYSGVVELNDADVGLKTPLRSQVLYVPGDGSWLYGDLSALEHLRCVSSAWGHYDLTDAARRYGVQNCLRRPARKLSLGQKQRLTLAMAQGSNAKHLLLDEPFNGLDPSGVHSATVELKQHALGGCGMLVSSHILAELAELCDTILFLTKDGIVEVAEQSATELASLFRSLYCR